MNGLVMSWSAMTRTPTLSTFTPQDIGSGQEPDIDANWVPFHVQPMQLEAHDAPPVGLPLASASNTNRVNGVA